LKSRASLLVCRLQSYTIWQGVHVTTMGSVSLRVFGTLLSFGLVACEAEVSGIGGDVGDSSDIVAADDAESVTLYAGSFSVGQYVTVCNCSGLNQRSGPGSGYGVLRVLPTGSTVKVVAVSGSWYQNDWGGRVGWSSGTYLCGTGGDSGGGSADDPSTASFDAPLSRAGIVSVAKAAVGFSYWWGGARFATGASHGSCSGSCPSCSHSGSYGADCSGFVAKAWMLPEAMPMSSNLHPFSSSSFYNSTTHWSGVSRNSLERADALVYNSGGSGHIVLYESGDGWGSMWTYESRGCSYGVVHNVRTAGSTYKGIRRQSL
jgi:uncharacterized protein YraI